MSALFKLAAAATLFASYAAALGGMKRDLGPDQLQDAADVFAQDGGITNATFQQLLNHDDPGRGTFTQHYIFNADFWTPGGPIIFTTPGNDALANNVDDIDKDSYLGHFAQQAGAALVSLEHRYFGKSSPYDEMVVANMQYLTVSNIVADFTYFANNVELPFDPNCTSGPDKAPWVFAGCSYAGAVVAWTEHIDPGTFYAYQASSAMVEALDDFWQSAVIIEQAMAPNCSADVSKAIDAIDKILLGDDETAKYQLKDTFGLANLHDGDFAYALALVFWEWDSITFAGGNSTFFQFCDYVENLWPGSSENVPGPEGVGAEKALDGYARYMKEVWAPGTCDAYGDMFGPNSTECLNFENEANPMYADLSPANPLSRQWAWLDCNEPFGWWPNRGESKILSRLLTSEYNKGWCDLVFPTGPDGLTYGLNSGRTEHQTNALTGGWGNVNTTRLIWSVGEVESWRPVTVASTIRPGGPLASTPEHPVYIIPGGTVCSDFVWENYAANDGVREVVDDEIKVLSQWMEEFYDKQGKEWPGRGI